ncbi:RING finger protein [Sporobolomyces salmoneus]|uniref:RING finger protein n=1 Tax=Sporobolomyces salmoneus TaxID=183962 RepID=UPI00316D9E22
MATLTRNPSSSATPQPPLASSSSSSSSSNILPPLPGPPPPPMHSPFRWAPIASTSTSASASNSASTSNSNSNSNVIDLTGSSPPAAASNPVHSRFPHLSFPSASSSTSSALTNANAVAGPSNPNPTRRTRSQSRQQIAAGAGGELVISDSDSDETIQRRFRSRPTARRVRPQTGTGGGGGAVARPGIEDEDDDDLVIVSERAAVDPVPSTLRSRRFGGGNASSGNGTSNLRRNPLAPPPSHRLNPLPRRASPPPFIVPPNYPSISNPDPPRARNLRPLPARRGVVGGGGALATVATPEEILHMDDEDVLDRRLAQSLAAEELNAMGGNRAIDPIRVQAQAMRQAANSNTGAGGGGGRGYGGYILQQNRAAPGAGGAGEREMDPFEQLLGMRQEEAAGGGGRGGNDDNYRRSAAFVNALLGGGGANGNAGGRGVGGVLRGAGMDYFPPELRQFFGMGPGPLGGGGGYGNAAPGGWGGAAKVKAANKKYRVELSHPNPVRTGFSRDIIEPPDTNDNDELSASAKKKQKREKEEIEIQELEPVCASCLEPLKLGTEGKDGKVWGLQCGHVVCGKCLREAKERCEEILEKERGGWVLDVDLEDADREEEGVGRSPKKGKGKKRVIEIDEEEEDDDDLYAPPPSNSNSEDQSISSSKPRRLPPKNLASTGKIPVGGTTTSSKAKTKGKGKGKGKSKSSQDETGVEENWTTCPVSTCEGKGNDLLAEKGWSRPFELYA